MFCFFFVWLFAKSNVNKRSDAHRLSISSDEIVIITDQHVSGAAQMMLTTTQRSGLTNIALPEVIVREKWSNIISFLDDKRPKIVHLVCRGGSSRLMIDDDVVDGKMLGEIFGASDSSATCLLVMASHSDALFNKYMPEGKLKNIDHLVLREGKLDDKEFQQFSAGFYSALLHDQLTIASSIRRGFERIDKTIPLSSRSRVGNTVDLARFRYYANGVERSIEEIQIEKAQSR